VPTGSIAGLLTALETDHASDAISRFAGEPDEGVLAAQSAWTNEAFAGSSLPAILNRLREQGRADASALADGIAGKSPLALAVTLEAVRRTRGASSLEEALTQEYRVSRHSSMTHDFAEGIRAQLVDKDRNPRWSPSDHGEITDADIAAFFVTPSDGDLMLPRTAGAEVSEERV